MKVLLLVLSIFVVTSCSCSKEKASFETQEDARRLAKENSEFNAQKYRQQNANVQALRMVLRGDSSIADDCPQGDGWASIDFVNDADGSKIEVKCSTVSESIGCMVKEDFLKRPQASEDGRCNTTIPFPLPKIKI